jgi:TolA-binding protein
VSDPLKDAVEAFRDATSFEDAPVSRYTRTRVLNEVRRRKRQQALKVTFAIPLAAILLGSAAWAVTGQTIPVSLQRITETLGFHRSTKEPSRKKSLNSTATRSSSTKSSEQVISLPNPVLSNDSVAIEVKSPEAVRPATGNQHRRPATVHDDLFTERELLLYEKAHQAHFIEKNYDKALSAWDNYIKSVHNGRFAVEARYNRAICWLRLGHFAEARKALEPFAAGRYGNYRKSEANSLIEGMGTKEAQASTHATATE